MDDNPLDCLVIGGGPAGLTAAIYLARFHLDICVVDGGKSRAATTPCTRNHAGFPDGISGQELVARMREQAQRHGAKIIDGRMELEEAGIETVDGPAEAVAIAQDSITVDTAEGHFTFDSVYPALGSDVHCQLAEMVGARLNDDGCVGVDAHMRTSVEGIYAAGDVVIGLDQISNAMGHGGIAATTIRNDLAKERLLLR